MDGLRCRPCTWVASWKKLELNRWVTGLPPGTEETAMQKSAILFAALFAVSASVALAAPVRHAGEWETTIDKGQPLIACFPADETLDENTLMRPLAKIPGANCKVDSVKTAGDATSILIQCVIGGSTMTSSATITATGPDAFTSRVQSKGGAFKMPNGQTVPIPDSDTVTVSRRVGPCKPGDRQITH
jgi:hypothetical protein